MNSIPVRYLLDLKIEKSPYGTFVYVGEDDSILTTFNKLSGNKILSLPVGITGPYEFKRWILVDLLQLTRSILNRVSDLHDFFNEPIKSILNLQEITPSLELEKDPTLADLVKLLGKGNYHRILITKDNLPIGVLSQMDVVRFLDKNLHLIPESLRQTQISKLTGLTGVVCVSESDKVYNALQNICCNDFYGVGILNHENRLVGNLSVSDLRGISVEDLQGALKLTVNGFLTKTKSLLTKDIVYATPDSTFQTVLHQLVQKHVHRVYITDNTQFPLHVFSTSDAVNQIEFELSGVSGATE